LIGNSAAGAGDKSHWAGRSAIDTCGPMGKMILTVLGMVAEMELGLIRERQRVGIEATNAKSVVDRPSWKLPVLFSSPLN
jgi:hypothetical protein